MRISMLLACLAFALPALAERKTFEGGRFSVDFPEGWKKGEGPDDGHQLYRESADGEGTFSTYVLAVKKDHRADLEKILKERVKDLSKAGMNVSGDIEGQQQPFDGKPAVFATIPVEATFKGQKVRFAYYLVLIDAKDAVVIMQAALPRPAGEKLREDALAIIQSFREKEKE